MSLLAGIGKPINLDDLKLILTTPPVNNSGEWMTLQSVIVVHDPGEPKMHVSAGNDPKRAWNVYKFKSTVGNQ